MQTTQHGMIPCIEFFAQISFKKIIQDKAWWCEAGGIADEFHPAEGGAG